MSVIDLLFRVDDICRKYEKYDVEKLRSLDASSDDAFSHLYASFESQIEAAFNKLELASMETNRATKVALNAEIRRIKARLVDEIPKLQKLARKKVKGLTSEEIEARSDLILALPERINAIPEGNSMNAQLGHGASSSNKKIKFDHIIGDPDYDSNFYEQSEETSQFRQEYEMRKIKQDQGLDVISDGLDTLKNLAKDMNEELDRQVPLIDEIDTKVDKASSDLRRTNVRLKETLTQVRSTTNFCIDIVLICILLGIAAYLYNILQS